MEFLRPAVLVRTLRGWQRHSGFAPLVHYVNISFLGIAHLATVLDVRRRIHVL